jgi:Kef-type K+ transport system membrane component KefB
MPLIEALLLLLIASRLFGEIVERLGQPAMIGEIFAGLLLGPSVLHLIQYTPEIRAIADLGVLLLVFLTGMEMDSTALWRAFRGRGAWVSISGFVVPFILGTLVGYSFGRDATRSIFIGLCVAITALPVSIRILTDLGQLQSELGQRIVSAAVMNDVVSLLALGIILDVKNSGSSAVTLAESVAWALVKAILFMAAVAAASQLIRKYLVTRIRAGGPLDTFVSQLKGKESLFAVVLLFVIAFAALSQVLGLDFIVGAFFGSMLLSYAVLGKANYEEVRKTASNVAMGFLGPIFFAAIGLEFDASGLRDWKLAFAILAVAFIGKIFGGYLGGRLAGLDRRECWALGVGLNGRGVMELVIANIALAHGFIGKPLFTALVLMAVVTTFCTPFLLARSYRSNSVALARRAIAN